MSEREAAVAALGSALEMACRGTRVQVDRPESKALAEMLLLALSDAPEEARAIARALPGTLDAAWAEAEAMWHGEGFPLSVASNWPLRDTHIAAAAMEDAEADTPAAALLALAEKLRECRA